MVRTEFVPGQIQPFASPRRPAKEGAELVFNGRVRDTEGDQEIVALEYEHYEEMAERELQALAKEAETLFSIRDLSCRHRVGRIPVGEISLHVSIWAEHRGGALEAMTWFVSELKKRVPVWKWAILADGTKIPSADGHSQR